LTNSVSVSGKEPVAKKKNHTPLQEKLDELFIQELIARLEKGEDAVVEGMLVKIQCKPATLAVILKYLESRGVGSTYDDAGVNLLKDQLDRFEETLSPLGEYS
jgi:hypothetical protein